MAGLGWAKKGPLAGLAAAALAAWAFAAFLFDPLLKSALERAASSAAGAEVSVGSLRTRWLSGGLELFHVEAADPDAPLGNAVEFSRAALRLSPGALLRGCLVAREASVEGLRFGTPRRRSGALRRPPATPPGAAAARAALAPAREAAAERAGEARRAASLGLEEAKLASLAKLDEARDRAGEAQARWKARAAAAGGLSGEIRDIAREAGELGRGGSSPAALLARADRARRLQERARLAGEKLEAERRAARAELDALQGLLREAEELRRKDLDGLLEAAGLPGLDASEAAKRLLGGPAAARLSSAMRWLRLARDKAGRRRAAAASKPARRRGVDIAFPRPGDPPRFLVEAARLQGFWGPPGKEWALEGRLEGATSDPALYGKPATLVLDGASPEGARLRASALIDARGEPSSASLELDARGLPLSGASLGDGTLGASVRAGTGSLRGRLALTGEAWSGDFTAAAEGLVLEPAAAPPPPVGEAAAGALRALRGFSARLAVSGREDDLKLEFSSDIGRSLADAARRAAGERLAQERARLQARLDAAFSERRRPAEEKLRALSASALGPIEERKAELERALKGALSRAGGPALPRLDKLFGR